MAFLRIGTAPSSVLALKPMACSHSEKQQPAPLGTELLRSSTPRELSLSDVLLVPWKVPLARLSLSDLTWSLPCANSPSPGGVSGKQPEATIAHKCSWRPWITAGAKQDDQSFEGKPGE